MKQNEQAATCEYCHTDIGGYSTYLPRIGKGNAFIRKVPFDGWILDINGPYRTNLIIKIGFCPKCGRELK